jgi:cytochrome P450
MSDTRPLAVPVRFPNEKPAEDLSARGVAAAWKRNALAGFPRAAFEEMVVARRFFGRTQLIVNEPEALHRILVGNAENYGRTAGVYRILHPIVGNGLLLANGEDWRAQRRTVAPTFAPRTLPLLARHVAAAADGLVAELAAEGDRDIDLGDRMQDLALAIAGRSMFSLETAAFGPQMRELLLGYAERLGRPTLLDILLPRVLPTWRDLQRWRFRRRWIGLIRRIIAARRAQAAADADTPRDLLDLLAASRDPESGAAIGETRLADQVATLIVAGHATTAVALFWALFLIAADRAAQDRLAAEVAGCDLGPDGAAAALPQLVYTRAVVQEALRLYPPAASIVRRARRADSAGPLAVPARAVVLIVPWVLHRHRRLWEDPDTFRPERFMPGAPPPERFAYLPFGAGPRVCVGAQFALTEAVLVLARLVQAFVIERADDEPVVPVAAITLRPDRKVPFRLRPRTAKPVQ